MKPAALFLLLAIFSVSQKTYTSADRSFEIRYPTSYVLMAGSDIHEEPEGPQSVADQPYIPVCSGYNRSTPDGKTLLACIMYSPDEYRGTNLGGSGLQISEIKFAKSEDACIHLPPSPTSEHPTFELSKQSPLLMINGVRFAHGTNEGVAAGHSNQSDQYRTFHQGRCYELAINLSETSFAALEPGAVREFTSKNRSKVHAELTKVLKTFKFLR
jgi:hypothetical protein